MDEVLVSKYEIISTLGRGSMGVVYKARDPDVGRLVALKTLRSVLLADDEKGNEALKRFRQESRSAGRLHHPNIVTIFEAGRAENGSPYIAMELIEGKGLDEVLQECSPLEPLEVLHYLAQIASALDYAHGENVIHRDIKPSNVLIDGNFRPHLLDFGVAKISDTSLTPAGTVVGTPSYMSPEQIRGETLDGSTDLFSFSVMAYELFTGVRPFPGKDFTTVVSNIIHKEPLSFEEVHSSLPKALQPILFRGLEKDRKERFASALELVDLMADVFGVVIDGGGIIGGYRKGMTVENVLKRKDRSHVNGRESFDAFVDNQKNSFENTLKSSSSNEEISKPTASQSDSEQKKETFLGQEQRKGSRGLLNFGYFTLVSLLLLGGVFLVFPRGSEKFSKQFDQEFSPVEESNSVDKKTESPIIYKEVLNSTENDLSNLSSEQISAKNDEELASLLKNTLFNKNTQLLLSSGKTVLEVFKTISSEAAKRDSEVVSQALIEASDKDDYLLRIEALRALSSTVHQSREDSFKAIVFHLDDDEYLVRGFAAKVLGVIGSQDALTALKQRSLVESHELVQKVLGSSIAKLERDLQAENSS